MTFVIGGAILFRLSRERFQQVVSVLILALVIWLLAR
jgi:hypothetical protein